VGWTYTKEHDRQTEGLGSWVSLDCPACWGPVPSASPLGSGMCPPRCGTCGLRVAVEGAYRTKTGASSGHVVALDPPMEHEAYGLKRSDYRHAHDFHDAVREAMGEPVEYGW